MNAKQIHALCLRDTDVDGALGRLCGNADVYEACLRAFLEDGTVAALNTAIENDRWDDAFTAAHALKGVAGNMGFVPLMHRTGQLIVLIRGGRRLEVAAALEQVNSSYRDIIDGIRQYFALADRSEEGEAI